MFKIYKGLSRHWMLLLLMLVFLLVQVFSTLMLPNLMSKIVDNGIVTGDTKFILITGAKMLMVTLCGSLAAIAVGFFSSKISVRHCCDVRKRLFFHIERFTLSEFDHLGTASLITRTTNDVQQIQDFTVMLFRVMLLAPFLAMGAIVMAMIKQPKMVWIIYIMVPVLLVLVFFIGKTATPIFKAVQKKLDELNVIMRENLTGVRVIRAFVSDTKEQKRFAKANAQMRNTSTKGQTLIAVLMPSIMLILNVANIFVLWYGAKSVGAGVMQVGDVMAFLQYVMQILFAMVMISVVFVMLPRASVCAQRINEVMAILPSIEDTATPANVSGMSGTVQYQDVCFAYKGAQTDAIQHITFTAKPGTTTAIIGSTGCGKSTVISLLPRLYDVTGGTITIDGVNVKDFSIRDLREIIGYVPQKAMLFSGTIGSNIGYSAENMSAQDIAKAAEISQSSAFIQGKEKGFEDGIAQGGSNVSGGQKQRLSIARALAKRDAKIYVFDDSFSALDFKTDALLRAQIKEEYANATLIIVAQRINTIMDADNIIVMEKGEMIGQGTHDQLLQSCQAYAEIAKSQLS